MGDPKAGALASNGQGPPSITDRLRSTADDAQAAADLIGAGAAGLAAAQAFRSQLVQDAAEYVRLNALPCPGPPPQIIGRPSDVERLLDKAGQRAQEVERGAPPARCPTSSRNRSTSSGRPMICGGGCGCGPGRGILSCGRTQLRPGGAGGGRPAQPRALLLLHPQGPLLPALHRPRCADGP